MSASTPAPGTGVIGCVDPTGRWHEALAHWCEGKEARYAFKDDPFHLWHLAGAPRPTLFRSPTLLGALVGEVFVTRQAKSSLQIPGDIGPWIMEAYHRVGEDLVEGLIGQFSLVLWDRERKILRLYADDCSAQKVYFQEIASPSDGKGFVFSSDLDLLVASPAVEKRLSRPSLHEYLRFLDVSPPNTVYDRVHAVEAGTWLCLDGHGLQTRTRQAPDAAAAPGRLSLVEASEGLDGLLEQAVAARLDPEGPTVVFLSGGVDSTLLCAIAKTLAPRRVKAVTIGFQESGFDESQVAAGIANCIGVEHQIVSLPLEEYPPLFKALYSAVEYPFADPAAMATLAAFRCAQETGSVALDGTGADTLLGIMPARHYRLAIQYGSLLPPRLRRALARGMKPLPVLQGLAPLIDFDDPEELLIRWRGWSKREIAALCAEDVSLAHTRFYRLFRSFDRRAHLARYSALLASLPDDRIHQAARLTGLRVRFPYFDQAVSSYLRDLDTSLKYRDGESKVILKAVLERRVPRRLWDVPKHGFDFPFVDLLARDGFALVHEYLSAETIGRWGLFDVARLKPTIRAFLAGDRGCAFKLWALVVLFAWLEHHYRSL